MTMRILLVGSGGREHAIADAFMRSKHELELYVFGNTDNPGIKPLTAGYEVGDLCDVHQVVEFAKKNAVDFAFLGPEAPIAAGLADALLEADIHSVAPLKKLAQLESSKGYTRDLLDKYAIPANPAYKRFSSTSGMLEFATQLDGQFVVKADGLKGGKGVSVAGDHFQSLEEGLQIAKSYLEQDGTVVIEEKLIGQEFSLMSFTDGINCIEMPAIQDHKRAFDGDKGPNTGGMGSYTDRDHLLPFLKAEDVDVAREITRKVAAALYSETGEKYRGIMYGGFIVTSRGVKLIEYNARLGDPESLNVLPILKTDFVDICQAIMYDGLGDLEVEFEPKATVCKYVVPQGYPDNPLKGETIEIGSMPAGVSLFFASVNQQDETLVLAGSRAIGVVGIADTISEAEILAEKGAQAIYGKVFHRQDIGTSALIEKRVKMIEEIRGNRTA